MVGWALRFFNVNNYSEIKSALGHFSILMCVDNAERGPGGTLMGLDPTFSIKLTHGAAIIKPECLYAYQNSKNKMVS